MVNPLSKKLTFSAHLPLALELTVLTVLGLLGWQLGQERLLLPWPGLAVWLTVGLVWLLPGFVLLRMVTPDTAWPWFGWLPLSFGLGLVWLMLPVGTVFYFNLNLDYLVWLVPRLNSLLLAAYVVLRLGGRLRWPGGCPPGPPRGGEGSQIPPAEGLGGAVDHPALTRWLLALAVLAQIAMLWFFWDTYGFPNDGDDWSYVRFIQGFVENEPVALRSEPAELYFLLLAMVTRLSGAALPDVYRLHLQLFFLIIANLLFLTLGYTLFRNKAMVYLAFVVQTLYVLSDIYADSNGVGLRLLSRLLEDKVAAWLLILPLTQIFFLLFVRSGQVRFLGLFGVMAVVNAIVHPVATVWIVLSVGGAGLLFAVFGPQRRMITFLIPFLAIAGVIISIGGWTQSFKSDLTFDTSIATEGSLLISLGRVYFFSIEQNRYMGHPFLLSHPLVILALLACVWLLFRLRRSLPAQFLFSNMMVVLLLIFNPITAPLIGQIIGFWQIIRVVWLLPVALTMSYVLYEWSGILSRFLVSRHAIAAKNGALGRGLLLTVVLVALAGLLANNISTSWRSLHVWNRMTITTAERQLTTYLQDQVSERGQLLAPPELGTRLGAQVIQLQSVTFRLYDTERLADVNRFYNSRHLDQVALDLLQQFRTTYLVIERDRPLEEQLRFMPGAFTLRYANPDYALYSWQPAQLSDSGRAVVDGNTQLGDGDLAAAGAAYWQALSLEPDQPLAVMGLSDVYQAQGQIDQALGLLQAAVERSPNNPWLRLELGQLMSLTAAGDITRLGQAVAAIAQALALAPNDLAVASATATAFSQLSPPTRQLTAAQELRTNLATFFQRRAAAEPDNYQRQDKLAQILEQLGQPEASIAQYRHMTAVVPGHPEPYLQQGRLYRLLDQPEQAAKVYQEALTYQAQPKADYVYLVIADFYLSQGQLVEALAYSEQAALLAESLMHYTILGQVYAQQAAIYEQMQQPDQALAHLQLAIQTQPDNADLQIRLAQFYQELGDLEQAIRYYRTAVETPPPMAWHHLSLAAALLADGQQAAGIGQLEQAAALATEDRSVNFRIGQLLLEYQRPRQSVSYLLAATQGDPEQVHGRWLLARAFEQLGQPDKAPLVWLDTDYGKFYVNWALAQRYPADSPVGSAYRANLQSTAPDTIRLPQDPGFSPYQAQALAGVLTEGLWSREQFLAAVSTLVENDLGQATDLFFQTLREQLPADADVQFLFAELLYQRGDTAGARSAYEQTLSLDPGFVKAKERLELLESGTGNNLDNSELHK